MDGDDIMSDDTRQETAAPIVNHGEDEAQRSCGTLFLLLL